MKIISYNRAIIIYDSIIILYDWYIYLLYTIYGQVMMHIYTYTYVLFVIFHIIPITNYKLIDY